MTSEEIFSGIDEGRLLAWRTLVAGGWEGILPASFPLARNVFRPIVSDVRPVRDASGSA